MYFDPSSLRLGYAFETETDTEAMIHLIDEAFRENAALEDAVLAALHQVEGAYGIAVVSSRDPGKIVVAPKGESAPHRDRQEW